MGTFVSSNGSGIAGYSADDPVGADDHVYE